MKTAQKLMVLGAFLGTHSLVHAFTPADPSTLLSAKAAARGGSTAATSEQNIDGLLLNAASLAFQDQYAISFGLTGMGGSLAASVVDSKSGPLGGGLYYIRRDLNSQDPATLLLGDYRRLEERAGLSLFTKFSDRFAMGLGGKYFSQKSKADGIKNGRAFNGDLSFAVTASPEMKFAFTAQNLLTDESGAAPRAYVFATEYKVQSNLSFSAQLTNFGSSTLASNFDFPTSSSTAWSAGAMYRINSFELRAGFLNNNTWNRQVISGGVGYGDKKFSLDYAFQYEQRTANQFHGVSVTGYL